MSSIGTGYDLGISYSPDGRIFQVEYAYKAVENAGNAIGIRAKDGIVLATEKLITSRMLKPGTNRRIESVDNHIGFAMTGLLPDGRHLIQRAREEAASFRDNYSSPITGKILSNRLGMYKHNFTLFSSVRPFGITTIIGSVDKNGPNLWMVEPSGTFMGYYGAATGKGRQVARNELEKLNYEELTVKEAVYAAAKIILATHDEQKDKEYELEMTWISEELSGGKHSPVPAELVSDAQRIALNARDEQMIE